MLAECRNSDTGFADQTFREKRKWETLYLSTSWMPGSRHHQSSLRENF